MGWAWLTRIWASSRVGEAVGDAHHVVVVVVLGVAAHLDGVFLGLGHVGDDGLDVLDAVEGEADDAAGEVGVAAAEVVGGFLHHQHILALFPGGDGGAEGGVAGPHHDDVINFVGQNRTSPSVDNWKLSQD